MRLWSIHPKYLDTKGLLAVWREGLLAKTVLEKKTKGYKNHPQLFRFLSDKKPVEAINAYLFQIYLEAIRRGFNFDETKIIKKQLEKTIFVTNKQVNYEVEHLLKKLKSRDKKRYLELIKIKRINVNLIFKVRKGEIEKWEKIKK